MKAMWTPGRRAPIYADVPDDQWNNWRWQLSHRLNTADEIGQVLRLTPSESKALAATPLLPVAGWPSRPPAAREPFTAMMADSLAEDAHSPVPGLVHRYPDRVLMLVTTQCASYCRYCTRSRIV